MALVNSEGTFRMQPVGWTIQEWPSGSVSVDLHCLLIERKDPLADKWIDWRAKAHEVFGSIFVVKKNGEPNLGNQEILMKELGWDGTADQIFRAVSAEGALAPGVIVGRVVRDTYEKAKHPFKLDSIGETPPGLYRPAADKVPELSAKLNAKLKGTYVAPVEPVEGIEPTEGGVPF